MSLFGSQMHSRTQSTLSRECSDESGNFMPLCAKLLGEVPAAGLLTEAHGCMCCLQAAVAKSDMGFFGVLPVSIASSELGSNKRKSKELGPQLAHAETQHVRHILSCCSAVSLIRALVGLPLA